MSMYPPEAAARSLRHRVAPRPRLVTTDGVLGEVSALARTLERGGQDLWAANLRACLYADGSARVFADVGLELWRLRDSFAARSLRLVERVEVLLGTLTAVVGPPDDRELPLYAALRDLVDALRLGAAGRPGADWVARLEAARHGDAARVDELLAEMAAAIDDEPLTARVEGVRARLARGGASCLPAALRPPV